jgi:hypothetical protein
MFSSLWLQQHPVILVLLHTLSNVLRFLPFYSGQRLIKDGLNFNRSVLNQERGVNENWEIKKILDSFRLNLVSYFPITS